MYLKSERSSGKLEVGRLSIEFRIVNEAHEMERIEDIEVAIWNREETVPSHQLLAASKNGGVVIGAFDNSLSKVPERERLVGFSYAFPATDQKTTWLYSHMTGFLENYRGKNLGFKIKCFQRLAALQKGYDLITWTYDPLFAANGRLNIGKLGGIVAQYECNYYGNLRDSFNVGLPSDRCIVKWHISSTRVESMLSSETNEPTLDDVSAIPSVLKVSFITLNPSSKDDEFPVPQNAVLDAKEDKLVLPIPKDFPQIKSRDNSLALSWRLATKEIFVTYLGKGYVLSGALIDKDLAYYILEKDSPKFTESRFERKQTEG